MAFSVRVHDSPADAGGTRVLADRIWPRGVQKADAALGYWNKEDAPLTQLGKWYGHDPEKFTEFCRRYRAELDTGAGRRTGVETPRPRTR